MNDLSFLEHIRGQRILIAALNWGLGHAARCIPIIRKLEQNNAILIGSDGAALELLIKEFPNTSYVKLPAYDIHYKSKHFVWGIFKQSPKLAKAISKEMSLTEDIVNQFKLTMIISDHRLGCRDKRIRSIIIAHQLQVQAKLKIASTVGSHTNKFFINSFSECWIPDYQQENMRLAGSLSDHTGIKNYRYIGPISRMSPSNKNQEYDLAVVLSGPEPSRSTLESKLYKRLQSENLKICWVRGLEKPKSQDIFSKGDVVISMSTASELNKIINHSKILIARSGYTTIMDVVRLNKQCILIPTLGQTEQEYLASYLEGREGFHFIAEENLSNLSNTIRKLIID